MNKRPRWNWESWFMSWGAVIILGLLAFILGTWIISTVLGWSTSGGRLLLGLLFFVIPFLFLVGARRSSIRSPANDLTLVVFILILLATVLYWGFSSDPVKDGITYVAGLGTLLLAWVAYQSLLENRMISARNLETAMQSVEEVRKTRTERNRPVLVPDLEPYAPPVRGVKGGESVESKVGTVRIMASNYGVQPAKDVKVILSKGLADRGGMKTQISTLSPGKSVNWVTSTSAGLLIRDRKRRNIA